MSRLHQLLREAEAAGLTFELKGDEVRAKAPAPPPPDLLARLREHRAELREHLARSGRAPLDEPPDRPPGVQRSALPDRWLFGIAASLGRALDAGAVQVPTAAGWLALLRPDAIRLEVAPRVVAELAQAGLLPPHLDRQTMTEAKR